MPTLSREEAHAFNDHFAAFEEESGVVIRVNFPAHGDRDAWLARASNAFDDIWKEASKALAFARTHLRERQAALWQQYDTAGVGDNALSLFSLWLEPVDGTACWHVVYDGDFALPPGLPEFPDDVMVAVDRSANGWLTIGESRYDDGHDLPLRCPCCYCKTLTRRAVHAICPVCFWEDDGQDDHDADVVMGGPNYELSLTQARANYATFGASRSKDLPHVRTARPEELPDRD